MKKQKSRVPSPESNKGPVSRVPGLASNAPLGSFNDSGPGTRDSGHIINPQVISDHGLTPEEYERICAHLCREPTLVELGVFSVMWSEHCSYKSSRIHLKRLPTKGKQVVCGPGENAGVVDLGDGLCAVFKMESHNHPSFIEPYQGAATGVGGILRDVFTMGARPIALLDSLRFGDLELKKTHSLVHGVVAGIAGYGNCMGIPTVGGETAFDSSFNGNNLVNAFCIGIVPKKKIFLARAAGVGNPIIYVGAKTGRDGIHGATMASSIFGGNAAPSASGGRGPHPPEPLSGEPAKPVSPSPEHDTEIDSKRPTVQVGDPFTEKRLLEACQELMAGGDIVAIQDMGAAGLTCSSVEMAASGRVGIELNLDNVPCREEKMTAYEMMLSESQERMLMVAKKGSERRVKKVFEKWDLDAAVVGRVVKGNQVIVHHEGKIVARLPSLPITKEAPLYKRPSSVPKYQKRVKKLNISRLRQPERFEPVLEKMLCSPNLSSKRWIYRQYDHMVGTDTVVLPGSDAAILRLKGTGKKGRPDKGLAITVDCNSRYCYLDPKRGAMLAIAEAARNLACSGAKPLAVTDCLNFGNPENPEIMWQFEQAIEGMREACMALKTPIVSGNVSFYNETQGQAIDPTPTIGMVGHIDDVTRHCRQFFQDEGDVIVLLGWNRPELGGSEYLFSIHGKKAGRPLPVDLVKEKCLQDLCLTMTRKGWLKSAHDISDGGLAVALAEACIGSESQPIGACVRVPGSSRLDVALFGEAPSRVLVSVSPEYVDEVMHLSRKKGCPARKIGHVGGNQLVIGDIFSVTIEKMAKWWWDSFEKCVGV